MGHGLLHHAIEEFSARGGMPTVEAEGELVQIVVQMVHISSLKSLEVSELRPHAELGVYPERLSCHDRGGHMSGRST